MKTTILMEIRLAEGQMIDPAHEKEYLTSFTALAMKLQEVLLKQEKLATKIKVTLK